MASTTGRWAVILGASSGFGAATALALAETGFDIYGLHLDRRQTLPLAEAVQAAIGARGRRAVFVNANAADPATIPDLASNACAAVQAGGGQVAVLLHSLAFGTLKPFVADQARDRVTPAQVQMTVEVMGSSLIYWVQELAARGALARGGRVFAMTSSGSTRVIPSYGPVSMAKAALEAACRQLAFELMPRGVTVNALCAGVTDTPALRKIPGHERLMAGALERNPGGRLTRAEDVAGMIAAMTDPRFDWVTGNVIRVDGGEEVVA